MNRSEAGPMNRPNRAPATVMVVDDERDPRESVCEWLAARGYSVMAASDGADALRQLRSDAHHRPDVILLDLMMPVMNGWQFRELQESDPQLASIPVIVVTANRDTRGIRADGTLFKPVRPEQLLEAVERLSSAEPALSVASPHAPAAAGTGRTRKTARSAAQRGPVVRNASPEPAAPVPFNERFVEMLGHDLRNPLSAIAMTAGLLAAQAKTAEVAEPTARILAVVERMDLMVAHLVEFLRVRLGHELPLRREHTDLTALCEKEARELSDSKSCETRVSTSGALAGMWDRARLKLLLATLMTDACDRDQSRTPVQVHLDGENAGFVRIEVAHRGPAFVNFRPFTNDVEAECLRLGLGMFVVKEIVRAHGGNIEVESDAAGARIVVELPREAEPA
jgi:CheY-like chemotaxis protein